MTTGRSILTVMFTDIVGSTAMRNALGDDAANRRLGNHDTAVADAARAVGGRVVKHTGDGAMVSFSSARSAVECAVIVQRALHADGDRSPVVRIGCNAGEVEITADGDLFGQAVNAAARITGHADGGEILVSHVVRSLVGQQPGLDFVDRGPVELAGFDEPWQLFAVPWDGADRSVRAIRLLGDLAVTDSGHRIDEAASPRALLVLAAAALAGGTPVDRAELAFRLWPDSTDQQARTNLRKVLHEVRAWLPEADRWLDIDQRHIRLRTEEVDVDVDRFVGANDRAEHAAAIDAYAGDLLPGRWDDWVLDQRARLRDRVCRSLHALIDDATDPETVLALASRLVDVDALDESGYRALMRAHAELGNRAAAVRTFHQCTTVLERELGVEPAAATTAVYDAVRRPGGVEEPSADRHGDDAGPATVPLTGAGPVGAPQRSLRLIGREAELDWVNEQWTLAQTGGPRAAMVTGESGIGKSRLVGELATECERRGTSVLRAHAYESDGGRTLAPLLDWLRHEPVLAGAQRLPVEQRRDLGRLLPELVVAPQDQGVHPTDPSGRADPSGQADRSQTIGSAPTDEGAVRSRIFDAALAAIAGTGRPLLLVLDDLQWCGPDTVDFVLHVLRRSPMPALLVAITRRDHEDPTDPELDRKLTELRTAGVLDELALDRLGPEDTAAIVAAVTGKPVDDADADRVHASTDGHPLFVIEAARAGLTGGSGRMTATMHGVIQRRLGQLDDRQRRVLEIGAVIGRPFDVETVAAAAGRGDDEVVDDVDDLWRRGILREHGAGFDFGHEQIRHVVASGISPAQARRLHRVVAEALVASARVDPGAIADELADHYQSAGLDDLAIDALERAGARDITVGAHGEAIHRFERAVRLLAAQPPGPDRDDRELSLLTALGASLVVQDGYGADAARQTWDRVVALSHKLGTTLSPPVLRGLALSAIVNCEFDRAIRFGDELVAGNDPLGRIEGAYVLGVTRFWQGRFRESEDHLERALRDYDPRRSPDHRRLFSQDPKAVCLCRLAYLRVLQGRGREADLLRTQAEQLARDLEDPLTDWYVWTYSRMIDRELGQVTEQDPNEPPVGGFFDGTQRATRLYRAAADHDPSALDELERAVEEWRVQGHRLHLTHWLAVLAELRTEAGDLDAAAATVDEALQFSHDHGQRYNEPELLRLQASIHRRRGSTGDADDAARRAEAAADAMGANGLLVRIRIEQVLIRPDDPALRDSLHRLVTALEPVHLGRDLADARALLAVPA